MSSNIHFQAGPMFQQSPGWGGGEWYSPGMGGAPPGHGSPHPRPGPAQLTFDNAYNFHGSGSHAVMSQAGMSGPSEFSVAGLSAAGGHHPFSLQSHDARSAAVRAPGHSATPGQLMYETSYHSAPGQGLPYHVSMTAGAAAVTTDKNNLLQLSAAATPPRSHAHSHTVSHHGQGNLQPGYPPRPEEISSRSCDKLSAVTAGANSCSVSPGYPGLTVTAPVTQDERVTSSSRAGPRITKESPVHPAPLIPAPPDYRAPPPLYPGTELTSLLSAPVTNLLSPNSNTQQTFLACSAAVKLATRDTRSRVEGTKLSSPGTSQLPQTSSSNTDSAPSPLARITAAPHQANTHHITNNNKQESEEIVTELKYQDSFVSATQKKALTNSTSNQNSFSSVCSNILYSDPVLTSSVYHDDMMPQIDGNCDIDFDEDWMGFKKQQRTPGSATKLGSKKPKRPQNDGGDPENITLRTPKEVFKDVMEDEQFLSQLSDLQISDLTSREQQLHEVSPSCDCARAGFQGMSLKIKRSYFDKILSL